MAQDMIYFGEYSMTVWECIHFAIIKWGILMWQIIVLDDIGQFFYVFVDFLSSLSNNYGERVFKSSTIIVDFIISHFSSVSFSFIYLKLWCLVHTHSVQFSSVAQSCPTLCYPMNRSTPGLPVHQQLPESTQTHVHRVGDSIQPSHPLLSLSLPAVNLSQHQGLFQWVNSLHQLAKVLEFQLQHQSFPWTPRTDLL